LNLKNQTWKDISDLFNNNLGVNHRSLDQLKSKWDNLKTAAKKRNDALKRHLSKTGAAPDPTLNLTAKEERILAVMSGALEPIKNEFDSDNLSEYIPKVEMSGPRSPLSSIASHAESPVTAISVINLEADSSQETQRETQEEIQRDSEKQEGEDDDMKKVLGKRNANEMKTPGASSAVKRPRTNSKTLDQMRIEYLELQETLLKVRHSRFMQLMDTIEACAMAGCHERLDSSQLQTTAEGCKLADMISESFGVMEEI
jgi:hypothetical protein